MNMAVEDDTKVVVSMPEDKEQAQPSTPKSTKFLHLESLRGIASFVVSLQHFLETFIDPKRLTYNGLFIPDEFGGHYMVIIFFLLSGRVLCSSMISNNSIKNPDPKSFLDKISSALLRRPIRLGIPVAFILIISSFTYAPLSKYSPRLDMPSLTFFPQDWDAKRFSPVHKLSNIWEVLLHVMALFTNGLAPGDIIQLNGVIWTIPIEFWGSIFTYVMAVISYPLQSRPKWIFFLVIAFFSWWNTSYNFLFLAGLMICHLKAENVFTSLFSAYPSLLLPLEVVLFFLWILLWFAAKVLVKEFKLIDSYSFLIYEGILGKLNGKQAVWYDPVTSLSLSAICLLLFIEINTTLQRWLSFKPLVFLGRISFSLYLSHFPLLGLFALLWRALIKQAVPYEWAVFVTYLVYLPTTLIVAYILTVLIDEPTVRFAKRFVGCLFVIVHSI